MLSGTGARGVLKIGVLFVLARLLTPEDFGLLAAGLVVTRFTSILYELGVGPALVQREELERRHVATGFVSSLVTGLLLGAALWALAPAIAGFFRMEGLVPVIRALALAFPVSGAAVVAECLLQRGLRFQAMARIDVVSYAIGYALVGIGLALLGAGVWALVGAYLAKTVAKSALLFRASPHAKGLGFDRQAFRELITYGAGHTAGRLSNYFALQGDYLVVGRWLGAAALGLYERAYTLMAASVSLFGQVLDVVLFPIMSRIQADPERLAGSYRRGTAVAALLLLPASVACIILGPELIRVALGSRWTEAVLPFQILVLGMYFRTSYKVGDSVARATGAVYRRAWRQAVYAALVVGGSIVGQRWGLSGVATGVLVALAAVFLLTAHLGLSLTGVSWRRFRSLHRAPALLGLLVGAETWSLAAALRSLDAPPVAILAAVGVVLAATVAVVVRTRPRLLGEDGVWMIGRLRTFLPDAVATAVFGRARAP